MINSTNLDGHVLSMVLAMAAFTLSFVLSLLFLIQERLIKRRQVGRLSSILPSLEWMSRFNFICLALGTAALAAGILGGVTALQSARDPKAVVLHPTVLLTGLVLVLYALPVVLRKGALERARNVSRAGVAFYPLFIAVFLGAHAGI